LLAQEREELQAYPQAELDELTNLYIKKGLSKPTAKLVAQEPTDHDAFAAHADIELHINPHDLNSPWQVAIASALSFLCGGVIPLIAILSLPASVRLAATFVAVVLALIITGVLSALAGGAKKLRATIRVVLGGLIAMATTYLIGKLVGSRVL
jgi:vacuolar iron transporter family protein